MIYVGKVVRYLRAEIIHAVATCTWYLLPTLMWHLYLPTYCTSLPQVHVVTCTYLIQSLSPKERQRLIQGQQTLLHYGSLLITSSAYTSYLAPMADHCKLPHLGIVFDTCSIQVYLVSYKCRGQKPIRLQVEHYLPE